ncbi:TIGR04086 family membrane protein [Dorea longicatena]|uniref:TIGR04086 family membrane protein n=1 Tax=Dorea longicatena TaxID=88431 RepID=UPI000E4A21BB|nr:TIGR04086 family membrane protein [Dorea longicatena]RGU05851.1 TIGR04086 family membrane protein [Dorea longicatena]
MRKKEQNEVWIMWMVKALLAAYVVTGILLIILALALYKFELNEGAVTAGVTAVYLISTFTGGLVVGKLAKVRRFLWGIVLGILYFALLLLVTVGIYRTFHGNSTEILVTFALCAGGGMAGGMIS